MDHALPIFIAAKTPSFTRSYLPAPVFWPAQVAIVPPSASKTQEKNMMTFCPAVTEATATAPRVFTAVWRITEPIAVIEYWSPMGMPFQRRFLQRRPLGESSSRESLSSGNFLII